MENSKLTKMEYKALWQKENKAKMAEYARNYYKKRCENDVEYKKKLCDKVKKRYKPKRVNVLKNVEDDEVLKVVDDLDEPFIFPDPTGLDLNMDVII